MMFLDPKIDFVFKKLFGTTANKDILIDFLNSVLNKSDNQKIVNVEINDPTNIPNTILEKESIVDVRCTDKEKNHYIVEMQVMRQEDFIARAQYYSAVALSRQLQKGDKYKKLLPVIFIGILNFNLLKTLSYLSKHLILDTQTHQQEFIFSEFYIIELPKFTKNIDALNSIIEKWIYFFKNAEILKTVPQSFCDTQLEKALTVLAESNWSREQLEAYDRYRQAQDSLMDQFDTACSEAKARGKAEGKTEREIEIALEMLKEKTALSFISKITGLSIEEIKKLEKK